MREVVVRISGKDEELLQGIADKNNISVSTVIEEILREYIMDYTGVDLNDLSVEQLSQVYKSITGNSVDEGTAKSELILMITSVMNEDGSDEELCEDIEGLSKGELIEVCNRLGIAMDTDISRERIVEIIKKYAEVD